MTNLCTRLGLVSCAGCSLELDALPFGSLTRSIKSQSTLCHRRSHLKQLLKLQQHQLESSIFIDIPWPKDLFPDAYHCPWLSISIPKSSGISCWGSGSEISMPSLFSSRANEPWLPKVPLGSGADTPAWAKDDVLGTLYDLYGVPNSTCGPTRSSTFVMFLYFLTLIVFLNHPFFFAEIIWDCSKFQHSILRVKMLDICLQLGVIPRLSKGKFLSYVVFTEELEQFQKF